MALTERIARLHGKARAPWRVVGGSLVDVDANPVAGTVAAVVPTLAAASLRLVDCAGDLLDLCAPGSGYSIGDPRVCKAQAELRAAVEAHCKALLGAVTQ